jgi:hypothetical protein
MRLFASQMRPEQRVGVVQILRPGKAILATLERAEVKLVRGALYEYPTLSGAHPSMLRLRYVPMSHSHFLLRDSPARGKLIRGPTRSFRPASFLFARVAA